MATKTSKPTVEKKMAVVANELETKATAVIKQIQATLPAITRPDFGKMYEMNKADFKDNVHDSIIKMEVEKARIRTEERLYLAGDISYIESDELSRLRMAEDFYQPDLDFSPKKSKGGILSTDKLLNATSFLLLLASAYLAVTAIKKYKANFG